MSGKKRKLLEVMTQLDLFADEQDLQPAPVENARIGYYFYPGLEPEFYKQVRDENGYWRCEEKIPHNVFIRGELPYMDETDNAISTALARYLSTRGVYANKFEIICHFLAGSDRAYMKQIPLRITESKPKVRFTMDFDRITISFEVSSSKRFYMRQIDENHYEVVKLTTVHHSIMDTLLSQREYPLSSIPELIRLSGKLEEWFIVESSLDSINTNPVADGRSINLVRIVPNSKGMYNVSMGVKPIEESELLFVPGDGMPEYVARVGKENITVFRDLKTEKANRIALKNEIESGGTCYRISKSLYCVDLNVLMRIMEFMHYNPDRYIMEWPRGQALKFKGEFKPQSGERPFHIGYGIDWFEIEGNLQLDTDKYSIPELIAAAKTRDRNGYVRIDENTYARMSEAIQKELAKLSGIVQSGRKTVISKYQVGKLAELLEGSKLGLQASEEVQQLQQKMKDAYASNPEIPQNLNATLRDYQKEGYQWMSRLAAWDAGACLADDMGLGKTIQTITFMLSKASEGPSLVVVPKALTINWKNEIERFAQALKPIVLNDMKDKHGVVSIAGPSDVVICTYNLLATNQDMLTPKQWNVICLDEAHYIKNRDTKMSQVAMDLKGNHRVILTGTPVQNHLGELWNLFQFLNPGLLGNFEYFKGKLHSEEGVSEIRNAVLPFILRRSKEEVLTELPTKSEVDWIVQLSPSELAYYEGIRTKTELDIKRQAMQRVDIGMLQCLSKLRLASCSPSLADPEWVPQSSKVKDFMKLIKGIDVTQNSVLVFSQFTSFLEIIRREMDSKGYDYCYMDGSYSTAQRQREVDSFQSGEKNIFISSIKAGGIGLNLTAANYVIILDPWWNPATEDQAMDRAHRIGQVNDVTVIRMISGHTIEEKILRLHEMKRKISDDILTGTAQTSKLSYEDVKELVSSF